jgi:predicted small integral membrane protein
MGRAKNEEGQMVVELAVVAPVIIVVAIIAFNLMQFLGAVSRFDRVAPDAVMSQAVSPSGDVQQAGDQCSVVREAILEAMGNAPNIEVTVSEQTAWEAGKDDEDALLGFSFAPHLTRYACVLTFHPWPSSLTVAGIDASIPVCLTHERSFTVDRFSPGVLF